jgi:imidazolonepropionase-like amidohydrolase
MSSQRAAFSGTLQSRRRDDSPVVAHHRQTRHGDAVRAWHVHAVGLPYAEEAADWWIDSAGDMHDIPLDGAEDLPGGYVLSGLVDAHAHPALGAVGVTPLAWARQQSEEWGDLGICLIRDVGSPGGVTLEIAPTTGSPAYLSAGRFLAPAGRYIPELLPVPVEVEELTQAALAEVERDATWVKVIADFPNLETGGPNELNYPVEAIAAMVAAVHAAGARVAIHSTMPNVAELLGAGVDSIEHGPFIDEGCLAQMARNGCAWTPTLCALTHLRDDPEAPPDARAAMQGIAEQLAELLPQAAKLGVTVMAGTDTYGSIAQEVAHLAEFGLSPSQALAAATVWPREYLGVTGRADIVTYHHDPRDDPGQLATPAAVVVDGVRRR